MTHMHNLLKHSILGAFLIFLVNNANGQNIFYTEGEDCYQEVRDDKIETSGEIITIGWEVSKLFPAPYQITLRKGEETLDKRETGNLPMYVVNVHELGEGEIEITSSRDMAPIIIKVNHRHSYAKLAWWSLAIMCIMVAGYLYIIRRRRKARQQTEQGDVSPLLRKTKKYDSATVLFSDIQGFTKIAEHMNPEQLVDELDRYFIYFDELVDKYNVEKIKTIGDAYMCAGGVPDLDSANPIEVALVGLGMIDYVKERQSKGAFWNMRVGIHTGPLVSAVLGNKKKAFDIWGDSVNTASRMESSGVPGEVNVSGDTYIKIADYFECEHRGKMPVKYKGEIDMYFIKRLKPEYAEAGSTCKPNRALITRMQAMKVDDVLSEYVDKLREEASDAFVDRMEMLMMQCEMLSFSESLSLVDTMLAKLLLLYTYSNEECPKATRIEISELNIKLKKMHFYDDDMEALSRLLNRAQQKHKPETHIEEIVSDTFNMMYGRMDYAKQVKVLYECAATSGRHFSKREWQKQQEHNLDNLTYYTNSARELAEVPIKEQKEILEQIIRQF